MSDKNSHISNEMECPICSKLVSARAISEHVEVCMQGEDKVVELSRSTDSDNAKTNRNKLKLRKERQMPRDLQQGSIAELDQEDTTNHIDACSTLQDHYASSDLVDLFCSITPLVSHGDTSPANSFIDYGAIYRAAKKSKHKPFFEVSKAPCDYWNLCQSQVEFNGNDGSDSDENGAVSEHLVAGFEKAWLLTPQARQCMRNVRMQPFPFTGEAIDESTVDDFREDVAPVVATMTENLVIDLPDDVEIVSSQSQTAPWQPIEDISAKSSTPMSECLAYAANPQSSVGLSQHSSKKKTLSVLSQTGWFRVVAKNGAKARGCVDMDAGEVVCALPQGTICSFSAAQWCIPRPEHEKSLVPVARLRADVPGVSGEAWVSMNGRNVGSEFPITEIIGKRLCTSCNEEVSVANTLEWEEHVNMCSRRGDEGTLEVLDRAFPQNKQSVQATVDKAERQKGQEINRCSLETPTEMAQVPPKMMAVAIDSDAFEPQHSRKTLLPDNASEPPQKFGSPAKLSPNPLVGRAAREEREKKLAAQEAHWKSREAERARHEASSSSQQQQVIFEAESDQWAESKTQRVPPQQGAFIPRERRATNARPQLVNPLRAAAPAPAAGLSQSTASSPSTHGAQVHPVNPLPTNQQNPYPSVALPSSSSDLSAAREARLRAAEIKKAAFLAKRKAVTQEPTGHVTPQQQQQQQQQQHFQAQQVVPHTQSSMRAPLQPPRNELPQQPQSPKPHFHPLYNGVCPSCLSSFGSIRAFSIEEQEKHVGDCFCADL